MAFPKPLPRTIGAAGDITITITDTPDMIRNGDTVKAARKVSVAVERLDAAGNEIDVLRFDLTPHLTAQQTVRLGELIDNLRARADVELK